MATNALTTYHLVAEHQDDEYTNLEDDSQIQIVEPPKDFPLLESERTEEWATELLNEEDDFILTDPEDDREEESNQSQWGSLVPMTTVK